MLKEKDLVIIRLPSLGRMSSHMPIQLCGFEYLDRIRMGCPAGLISARSSISGF